MYVFIGRMPSGGFSMISVRTPAEKDRVLPPLILPPPPWLHPPLKYWCVPFQKKKKNPPPESDPVNPGVSGELIEISVTEESVILDSLTLQQVA